MKFLFNIAIACIFVLVCMGMNASAEETTEKTPLELYLTNKTGSQDIDQVMKTIFVEFLKANNLTQYKEAKLYIAGTKRILGCKDSCCRRVLGICVKWCYNCPFGSGGISVVDVWKWFGKK